MAKIEIDLDKATDDELRRIQGEIMNRLVKNAKKRGEPGALYSSHGSNHTNNTGVQPEK